MVFDMTCASRKHLFLKYIQIPEIPKYFYYIVLDLFMQKGQNRKVANSIKLIESVLQYILKIGEMLSKRIHFSRNIGTTVSDMYSWNITPWEPC